MPQAILLTIIFTTQAVLLCSGAGVTISYTGTAVLFFVLHGIGAVIKAAISRQEEDYYYLPKSGALMIWYGCLLVLLFLLYKVMLSGAHMLYQAVLFGLENYYGISLGADAMGEKIVLAPVLLLIFLSAVLLPVYQWGERYRLNWWFFVELSVFSVMLPMLLGNAPKLLPMLILLGALLFYRLLFFHPQWHKLSVQGRLIIGLSLLILMGVSVGISSLLEPSVREKHSTYMAFQRNLESRLGLDSWSDYNSGYLTNSKPVHTHQIMLNLTVNTPPRSKLYLRGYVGSRYNGSNWSEADKRSFYQKQQKNGQSKLDASVSNANYIYDRIDREYHAGERIAISYNQMYTPYVYAPYFSYYENNDKLLEENGDATLLRKTDTRMTLFYMEPDVVYESGMAGIMGDQSYQAFVDTEYKEVPGRLEKQLLEFLGGRKTRELSLSQKVELVTSKLQAQCDYQQELEALSLGEDYVEHFLWKEKAGYCTHFATAATLLFRCLDVPARYASGYQVNPEEFMSRGFDEYLAEIPDDMAHAWTEIYFPNIGWIPIETTPGYGDSIQQTAFMETEANASEQEEQPIQKEPSVVQPDSHAQATTQASENTQEAAAREQEKEVSAAGKFMTVVFCIIGTVVLLCVLVIVIYCGRQGYLKHLYRLRHQQDHKQALLSVTRQLIIGLRHLGYQRAENEDELTFLKTVLNDLIFPIGYGTEEDIIKKNGEGTAQRGALTREELAELIEQYYRSLSKAAYSLESVTKDDVSRANQLYDSIFK